MRRANMVFSIGFIAYALLVAKAGKLDLTNVMEIKRDKMLCFSCLLNETGLVD